MNKAMKAIVELDPERYDSRTAELKRSLYDLRVKQSIGQLEKPSKLRDIRRDLARIATLKRQVQLGRPAVAKPAPAPKPAAAKKPASKPKPAPAEKVKAKKPASAAPAEEKKTSRGAAAKAKK